MTAMTSLQQQLAGERYTAASVRRHSLLHMQQRPPAADLSDSS